jgi:nucleoside-diphosphate-sugar epimerase
MELTGKRVLVTGATGLLGRGLSRRLLDEGAQVVGLARSAKRATDLAARGVTIVEGDLSLPDGAVEAAMHDCSAVFHCAGVMGPDFEKSRSYFRTVNVEGTRRMAEAALAAEIERFVHVSTAWVYGFDAGPGTNELSPRRPSGDSYCDTKLEAENLVRGFVANRGLPAVIVQPTEVYGPGDRSWSLTPLRMMKSGWMMLPDGGKGVIQPIFADDVVEGILAAAQRGAVGEAHILCGSSVMSCAQFFGHYAEMVGKNKMPSVPSRLAEGMALLMTGVSRISRRPALLTRTAVRGLCLQATYDGGKARRELGFEPKTDLAAGMRAVREWLAGTGQLQ